MQFLIYVLRAKSSVAGGFRRLLSLMTSD